MTDFAHLHTHSEFSLCKAILSESSLNNVYSEGIASIQDITFRAVSLNMKHLAITDSGILYSIPEFRRTCFECGIHPIIGGEFYIADVDSSYTIVLLAETHSGYQNLVTLSSFSNTSPHEYRPLITLQMLSKHSEGLICLSGGAEGEIGTCILRGDITTARKKACIMRDIFGQNSFFLELQNFGHDSDRTLMAETASIACAEGIQLVATNNVLFIDPDEAEVYHTHILLATGNKWMDKKPRDFLQKNRTYDHVKEQYFKTGEEMAVLFPSHPDAISNTIKIAERCQEDVVKGPLVPNTSVPARFYDADERLRQLVMKGIGQRYPKNRESALERVEYELSIIKDKHYAFLYLIIDECLKITNEQSIAAGPGNGGVINSIIAYILGITNIDPLKYDLFFEHFINPDKDGSGSFTLNTIDYTNEEKIKSYINKTYPGDVVPYSARIIGQFTPAVKLFRDLIKVFYKDDKEQEKVLKFFANMDKWDDDLLKIITDESVVENFSNDAIFHKIVSIANKFPNLTSSFKLSDDDIIFLKDPSLIPLYTNSGISGPQYSCDELEKLGCISCKIQSSWGYSKIAQKINKIKSEYPHFNINEISENDHATMKQIIENNHPLKELNLSSLSELIPIYAVYELQYEDYLIYMKNCILKKKRITYLHKCLKDVLKETYGIIAYNEQIIKIIAKLTDYNLGKADAIFTDLQKKHYFKIEREKEEFIAAAKTKRFSRGKAEQIFDTLRSFAPLTSGKGDIIAKAVLDYQAAYIKVHFQGDV